MSVRPSRTAQVSRRTWESSGKRRGLTLDLAHEQVHEPLLEPQARLVGGAEDRPPQLVGAHRPEEEQARLDVSRQPRMGRQLPHAVAPQPEREAAAGIHEGRQEGGEVVALLRRGLEHLLELVDDDAPSADAERRRPDGHRLTAGVRTTTCRPSRSRTAATPALSSEDLPLPDGPTTARTWLRSRTRRAAATSASRPKNVVESSTSNGSSPG